MVYRSYFCAKILFFDYLSQTFLSLSNAVLIWGHIFEKIRYVTSEIRSQWRIIAGARYARAMLDAMCFFNFFPIKIFQMALEIKVKVFKAQSAAVLTLSVPNQIVNLG